MPGKGQNQVNISSEDEKDDEKFVNCESSQRAASQPMSHSHDGIEEKEETNNPNRSEERV